MGGAMIKTNLTTFTCKRINLILIVFVIDGVETAESLAFSAGYAGGLIYVRDFCCHRIRGIQEGCFR